MLNKPIYTLQEVADWAETNQVSLPTVQRGFVWRPNQIENLWDSLLRGYPVGAFVLANNGALGCEILDGQQRATAICLGFSKDTFRDSQDHIKVFIDLEKPGAEDNRKFIFRVITRSHPWGYRRSENNKTLTSDNIRKAMDLYDTTDPLITDLSHFFPFDSDFPLPFHFFINEVLNYGDLDQLYTKLNTWEHWNKILNNWKSKAANAGINEEDIETVLKQKIEVIFKAVFEMLDDETGQKIPALYMDLNKFNKDEEKQKEETADEIENLFVRLNSGGTQLSGEELNYSILKAHLSRETQETIENACKVLFRPSRFITVAYRLFQQTPQNEQQSDALSMRIKPKQFQRSIAKQVELFEKFLIEITTNKLYNNKTLLEYTKEVLAYDNKNKSFGLPFVIYSKIADGAPEVMFLLMYRILIKKDTFSNNTVPEIELYKKVLGIITLFYWFGRGENYKDHSKLLNNIWVAASTLNTQRFWSSETVERAHINKALLPFPVYTSNDNTLGIDTIVKYKLTDKTKIIEKFESEVGQEYRTFFQNIINKSDLILYAQRNFLENYFKQMQYRMEDTSVPFDWDHISPHNWIKKRPYIPQILKDWYQTNGNFRAWPYALNRMDSDSSPSHKLKPLIAKKYNNPAHYNAKKDKWETFINSNKHLISNTDEVNTKLIEWSFCEPKWGNCNITDIRREWKPVTELIIRRNCSIIEEWYKELLIENLKEQTQFSFKDILLKNKWNLIPINNETIDEAFDSDSVTWISNPFQIGNAKLRFYFYYYNLDFAYFQENGLRFGIYEKQGDDFIIRMKDSKTDYMDAVNFTWIEKVFTLISSNKEAINSLINEVLLWLNQLNYSDIEKEQLCKNLNQMIQKKYITNS
jgi:hypothetical protein